MTENTGSISSTRWTVIPFESNSLCTSSVSAKTVTGNTIIVEILKRTLNFTGRSPLKGGESPTQGIQFGRGEESLIEKGTHDVKGLGPQERSKLSIAIMGKTPTLHQQGFWAASRGRPSPRPHFGCPPCRVPVYTGHRAPR